MEQPAPASPSSPDLSRPCRAGVTLLSRRWYVSVTLSARSRRFAPGNPVKRAAKLPCNGVNFGWRVAVTLTHASFDVEGRIPRLVITTIEARLPGASKRVLR